jgi:RNase P subunit RPR2
MTIEEIPKSYQYTCDRCGHVHIQTNASGHYSNSTPPHWATVKVVGYDFKSIERLYCEKCSTPILKMLEQWRDTPK